MRDQMQAILIKDVYYCEADGVQHFVYAGTPVIVATLTGIEAWDMRTGRLIREPGTLVAKFNDNWFDVEVSDFVRDGAIEHKVDRG